MNERTLHDPGGTEPPDSVPTHLEAPTTTRLVRDDQQSVHPPVFVVDDTFFRARTPRSVHWSIGWADLMMTMFVLFLTLFVYQLAHREFLSEESPEVVAGSAIEVPEAELSLPIRPIAPILSEHKNETVIKRLETVKPEPQESVTPEIGDTTVAAQMFSQAERSVPDQPMGENTVVQQPQPLPTQVNETSTKDEQPDLLATRSAPAENKESQVSEAERNTTQTSRRSQVIASIYDLSKVTVSEQQLEKFAQVELIPDKALRIILTGDLLFPSGQAELTAKAKKSLRKLLPVIKKTPYMINVVGHTDNVPMHSGRFASNWELSTARASRVARFLIEEGKVDPRQITVTGYSYFRPVKPNTTAANRRANRRVEIILSHREPPVHSTSDEAAQSIQLQKKR